MRPMTSIARRFVLPLTYEMFANDSFELRRLVTTDMGASLPSKWRSRTAALPPTATIAATVAGRPKPVGQPL
jgi:hypothetical protein